ncbi:serine/threonine protein phosphatase, partial [Clostridium botulinum]|nr:serine/threonine protein phosphatase [Clostridium botulinum]
KKAGMEKFIVMLHYPATNDKFEDSPITELLKEYNVEKVIYGHLHGVSTTRSLEGLRDGVEYYLTSCDHINFDPVKIT